MENTYLDPNSESIDTWAYVEIFGHDQLAGRLTTKKLGTAVMIQIDVPKDKTEFSHSELFSPSSIFSIKPTTEEWCRSFTERRTNFNRNVIPYLPPSNDKAQERIEGFDKLLSPDDSEDLFN